MCKVVELHIYPTMDDRKNWTTWLFHNHRSRYVLAFCRNHCSLLLESDLALRISLSSCKTIFSQLETFTEHGIVHNLRQGVGNLGSRWNPSDLYAILEVLFNQLGLQQRTKFLTTWWSSSANEVIQGLAVCGDDPAV